MAADAGLLTISRAHKAAMKPRPQAISPPNPQKIQNQGIPIHQPDFPSSYAKNNIKIIQALFTVFQKLLQNPE
jgi:hypothetical protein